MDEGAIDGDAAIDVELVAFEAGRLDPTTFTHRDHVRIAHALLSRDRFTAAADRMSTGLRGMLVRAGRQDAYHETITIALLALIAERMDAAPSTFDAFATRHPELFERNVLDRVYGSDRLASPVARRTFVLP